MHLNRCRRWLPVSGRGSWLHLILPAITLGTGIAAEMTRLVFQYPFSSLNPRMIVMEIISKPIKTHTNKSKAEIEQEVFKLMEAVGLDKSYVSRYPHEFSGGQRQRIGIARAIALRPKLTICDEPISALCFDTSTNFKLINAASKRLSINIYFYCPWFTRCKIMILEGDIPSNVNLPSGCRFHTRCPFATEKCQLDTPELVEYEPGHEVACFYPLAN